MKDYISTLQSQIARNSVEISNLESQLFKHMEDYKQSTIELDSLCEGSFFTNIQKYEIDKQMNLNMLSYKYINIYKKTLKKLVENQKTLKKLKTQLVLLDNLYGEEDW